MFDKSSTWSRFSPQKREVLRVHLGHVPQLEEAAAEDRRRWAWATVAAIVLHGLLVLTGFRWFDRPTPEYTAAARSVYVMEQVRFQPPPAQAAQQQVIQKPKKKRRTIPVPDPTPHEPEPIEDLDVPEIEVDELLITVPEAPAGRGAGRGRARGTAGASGGAGEGPVHVGGNVSPPRKLYSPQPLYTEEARQNRVQGVVILSAIIDEQGGVEGIEVIRGLPHGLTESALETVASWRFEPARDEGRPVPVFYTLTISFTVQ